MAEQYSTYYQSPVGKLKISGTDTYISELTFCNKERISVAEGKQVNYIPSDQIPDLLLQCQEQLIQYFNGARRIFELPLSQKGTDFQQRTWHLLTAIPFGKTVSYLQMAKQYGDPKAIRARASANGQNNIAIVVPCHRVIGSDGKLIGYGGGLWRKKWLLEHEGKIANGVQLLF